MFVWLKDTGADDPPSGSGRGAIARARPWSGHYFHICVQDLYALAVGIIKNVGTGVGNGRCDA